MLAVDTDYHYIKIEDYSFYVKRGLVYKVVPDGLMKRAVEALEIPSRSETVIKNAPRMRVYYIDCYSVAKLLRLAPVLSDFFSPITFQSLQEASKKDDSEWPIPKLDDRLFPYQIKGVEWLLSNKGGYLADEMGLGKTIQALQFLENTPYSRALLVVPASVMHNWKDEMSEWAPSWEPFLLDSGRMINKSKKMEFGETKIAFIVTWSQIAITMEGLFHLNHEVIIMDEAHRAKSPRAKRTVAACSYSLMAQSTVLLSGTPMRNCAMDMFSQMSMVAPGEFYDEESFESRYSPPVVREAGYGSYRIHCESINMPELRKKCKPYLLHRKKKDVALQLPPKRYRKLSLATPSKVEAEWDFIKDALQNGSELEPGTLSQYRELLGLAKAEAIIDWVADNASQSNPLVIFITHKKVRAYLEDEFTKMGINHASIVGDIPKPTRGRIVNQFQSGRYEVIICSEAAKEGITLTKSSQLLQLERYWVPADEEQAEARVHRIGSENPVIITHAHMSGTLDDLIVSKLAKKRSAVREMFKNDLMDDEQLELFMSIIGEQR